MIQQPQKDQRGLGAQANPRLGTSGMLVCVSAKHGHIALYHGLALRTSRVNGADNRNREQQCTLKNKGGPGPESRHGKPTTHSLNLILMAWCRQRPQKAAAAHARRRHTDLSSLQYPRLPPVNQQERCQNTRSVDDPAQSQDPLDRVHQPNAKSEEGNSPRHWQVRPREHPLKAVEQPLGLLHGELRGKGARHQATAQRNDREAMCKAMDAVHGSQITTLDLSYGHAVTTILCTVAPVHRGHH